jgi:hypothetical protein
VKSRFPRRANRKIFVAVGVAALVLTGSAGAGAAAASGAPGAPVAVARTADGFVTVDGRGAVIRRFTMDANHISLDGSVVAVSTLTGAGDKALEQVIGLDARSGRELYRVRDAFAPTLVDGGRKVAFLPDRWGRRDKQGNSVWLRDADGSVRKIVQFSNGPGLPGIDNGMHGDGTVLSLALDRTGSRLLVTEGNDVDLFIYDVWSVEVATGKARRLTTGRKSRFPSLSADGRTAAYFTEDKLCGGEGAGYRTGTIRTVGTDGRAPKVIVRGSCDLIYTDPQWVSPTELAVARLTRTQKGDYTADLVRINVSSRRIVVLAKGINYLNASAAGHRAVYGTNGRAGFTIIDTVSMHRVNVREGSVPRLSGDHRW